MIVRQWSRHASKWSLRPNVSRWRRSLATETEVARLEASIESSLLETKSLHSDIHQFLPETFTARNSASAVPMDESPALRGYRTLQHHKSTTAKYGTTVSPYYQPHTLLSNPPSPSDVTLELLLASQAHLGHSTSLWNPANARYIFGIREGIHIISLDITAAYLRRAAKVVSAVTERGGLVLFVGTRPRFDRAVIKAAQLAGGYHLFERWTPGTITNGQAILGKCRTKVVNEFDEEMPGFTEQLRYRAVLKPDLVVCLNTLENYVMLRECGMHNIPTIGIVDTNANPTWVTYPIPANDDSMRCINLIAGVLGRAGEEGAAKRLAAAKNGQITYQPVKNLQPPSTDYEGLESASPDEMDEDSSQADEPLTNEDAVQQLKYTSTAPSLI